MVPRKRVEYRDATFEELDVDAVLARRPQVALVDELAHTNVPGSRNEKRWQDVEELLEAGINVISTLNIQHLESLNDVVEQITGVKQRETIPDEVVRRADELQLVDLTPLALRNRLARGDVYPPSGSTPRSPTTSGRATSPRCASSRSPGSPTGSTKASPSTARGTGSTQPWETRERVLVALTGSSDGERLVRRAARIAQRSKGELRRRPRRAAGRPRRAVGGAARRAARARRGARRHATTRSSAPTSARRSSTPRAR